MDNRLIALATRMLNQNSHKWLIDWSRKLPGALWRVLILTKSGWKKLIGLLTKLNVFIQTVDGEMSVSMEQIRDTVNHIPGLATAAERFISPPNHNDSSNNISVILGDT
jgi:hypothetical protein